MITLANIRDDFKNRFNWGNAISIGKIDKNKSLAICFYHSKRELSVIKTLGGKKNRSYDIKPISILLRFGDNQDTAEIMSQKIYDFYNESYFTINNIECFTEMVYSFPICLGTDENNIYEYSIEINIYEKKGSINKGNN